MVPALAVALSIRHDESRAPSLPVFFLIARSRWSFLPLSSLLQHAAPASWLFPIATVRGKQVLQSPALCAVLLAKFLRVCRNAKSAIAHARIHCEDRSVELALQVLQPKAASCDRLAATTLQTDAHYPYDPRQRAQPSMRKSSISAKTPEQAHAPSPQSGC